MAHKTLVGGTAYEIKGGRCLVNGTAYSVKKGRALIGGTGYDVSFSKTVPVTITGSGATSTIYVIINGTKYYKAASGIEIDTGNVIELYVSGGLGMSGTLYGKVIIDGNTVVNTDQKAGETYVWTVPSSTNAIEIYMYNTPMERYITVTTT